MQLSKKLNYLDRRFDDMEMAVDDLGRDPNNMAEAVSELRDRLHSLEEAIEDVQDDETLDLVAQDPNFIKECMQFGLMTIEARYGLNSNEHKACRKLIEAL